MPIEQIITDNSVVLVNTDDYDVVGAFLVKRDPNKPPQPNLHERVSALEEALQNADG